ncbi:MAG: TonB-dependent receptor [Acidobacteriota bacterium]
MKVFTSRYFAAAAKMALLAAVTLAFSISALAQAQATAADLSGTVVDQTGAVVAGATIHAKGLATGISRTATTDSQGNYQFIGLPPGEYEISTEASSFKKSVISGVKLTVGQSADLTIKLEIGDASAVVTVSGSDVQLIESTKTTVSSTIDQARINGLPINERSATGFALTISTVGRDNGRPVGPAPTSGLNIGGQRGRSTLVQVDGADFTDNSINAARSTVSQEAVQEYQVTTNSYLPEFGRATGGIVNVVTKRGTSDYHGNVFGFFRHKSIQSRNAFAPVIDGDPNKKPPYTRAQYGATFGGPLVHNGKNFFFASFEQRRRQESGFFTGDIIGGATSSITIGAPFLPGPQTFTNLTPAQVTYIQTILPISAAAGLAYAHLASAGGQTALNGTSTLVNFLPGLGVPQGSVIGSRFILSGAPIPLTKNAAGQYVAFRPLSQLAKIFPISEGTTYFSVRTDHAISTNNQLSARFGYNPSTINGIQDESQNQTLGQNDYSRTGIQTLKDLSFGVSLTTILPHNLVNEGYYNFGRRRATFDSQVPSVAHQIAGTGFIGSNPFSPVNRTENRHQVRDNLTWATGNHILKFGGDLNFVSVAARFELNFPALFNFSQQSGGSLVTGCDAASVPVALRCPAFTAIQTYGLGFPSVFIQGFGNPQSAIKNKPIAFFGQDTWKINRHLTINFGVRYDYEITQQFAPTPFTDPLTGIVLSASDVQTAQDALNVTQGFPRDKNNIAPRLGLAWDIGGNGKTVIRGAGGIFYDHPLLAVAFNSDIGDGSQQQQATLLPIGGPSPLGLFNAFQVFQGTLIKCNFAGATPGVNCTPGLAASAQYLAGFQRFDPSKFTGFGPILPFTLHVAKDFQYPEAFQGNLSIEHMIGKDMSLSASYITVEAHHLAHPQDVNIVRTDRLVSNFQRFFGFGPSGLSAAAFGITIPTTAAGGLGACPQSPNGCFTNAVGRTFAVIIPGMIVAPYVGAAGVPDLTNKVVNPVMANYFRKLGPNYFFIASASGGLVSKAIFDSQLGGSLATAGPINPYADVNSQLSDGNSSYNAMNIELKKRFSNNMLFYATYTWSHSIDDSSDLQTLLKPQDNTNFRAERSSSLFDQRHRFVFSGIMNAPDDWKSGSGIQRFMYGFSFAPILEISSGRPFNIIAPGDANGDFQSTNERPFVLPDGKLCRGGNAVAGDPNDPACVLGFPINGSLGRNLGITHNYFTLDARVTRKIRMGERMSLDVIAEGFNLFNRFNEAAANPFYNVVNIFNQRKGGKYYSQPTSAFDPRQFQFGLKLSF